MTSLTARSNAHLQPGTALKGGAFVIESYLAAGGFGITYKATDRYGRRVVIKEYFPLGIAQRDNNTHVQPISVSEEDKFEASLKLFRQEAETLKLINSDFVVRVIDVFEERGTAFMAMNYIDGPDFQTVIDKVPETLTPEYLMHFTVHLLEALEFVHASGIMHRDIKPGNILIDPNERPVIIDFGAAKVEATALTPVLSQSVRVASDGFSPQEFYVAAVDPTPAGDLYSVGATLWAAIEREAPVASIHRGLNANEGTLDKLRRLSGNHPEFDPTFLALIDKSLSLARKDRMQSASEWLAELRPLLAAPPPPEPVAPKPVPDKKPFPVAAALVGVLVGAGAMAGMVSTSDGVAEGLGRGIPDDIMEVVDRTRAAEREVADVNRQLRNAASQVASQAQQIESLNQQLTNSSAEQTNLQSQLSSAQASNRNLQNEIARSANETLNRDREIQRLTTDLNSRAAQIATLQSSLTQANTNINELRNQLAQANSGQSQIPTLTAQLEAARADTARIQQSLNQTRGELDQARATIRDRDQQIRALSSGGNANTAQVAQLNAQIQDLQNQIRQLNTTNSTLNSQIVGLQTRPTAPTSGLVAALSNPAQPVTQPVQPAAQVGSGSLAFWTSGQVQAVPLNLHTEQINGLAFSPDGSRLVSVSSDNLAMVWDATTGQRLRVLRETNKNLNAVAYSPDGSYFVTIGDHPEMQVWNSQTMQVERRIPIGADIGHSVAIGAGGNLIAAGVGEGDLRVWNRNGQVVAQTRGHNDWVSTVAFSPDGQFLATGGLDNAVRIWTAQSLARIGNLAEHSAWLSKVTFSPDGQSLLSIDEEGAVNLSVQAGRGWGQATSRTIANNSVISAGFLPSNDGLITVRSGRGNQVEVTDTQLGTRRDLASNPGASDALAISPDGRRAAAGARNGTVQLFIRQ